MKDNELIEKVISE